MFIFEHGVFSFHFEMIVEWYIRGQWQWDRTKKGRCESSFDQGMKCVVRVVNRFLMRCVMLQTEVDLGNTT